MWTGAGSGWRPLTTGCPPETADQCTGTCEQAGGTAGTTVIRPPATLCFLAQTGDPTPDDPAAVIEQVIETVNGVSYVHIRVTFDPAFVDMTYGTNSSSGWNPKRPHTFTDLLKSDHTELLLTNGSANTVMNFKIDLVDTNATAPCGYATAGVTGGDGSVIVGDPADVLAVATSLDRNLGGCAYCDAAACGGDCLVNSPATDDLFTPNAETPNWDYRQVYEVWIALDAFGTSGFGQAYITYTHASPAKGTDTVTVEPGPCPPTWTQTYCPPGMTYCFTGTGGTSGVGGSGGEATDSGVPTGGICAPNWQLYQPSEGVPICTPIPFANYPGFAACPAGYTLDIPSEGRFCIATP
jgi:hypothetical protein